MQRDICQAVIGRDVVVKPSLDVIAGCRASIEDGRHQSRVCSCPSKIYDKYIWRFCFRSFKHGFDAETVRLLGIAFETAIVALRQTCGMADPPRDEIVRIIIELAQAGERDPDLCEAVLKALGAAGALLNLRNISLGPELCIGSGGPAAFMETPPAPLRRG